MGTYNIGPCACCGGGGGGGPPCPDCTTCVSCLALVTAILTTVADFADHSCSQGANTLNQPFSNLNASYLAATLVSSSSTHKTFRLELGTEGDSGDRGVLWQHIFVTATGENVAKHYVYQVDMTVSCITQDFISKLRVDIASRTQVFVGATETFDSTGPGPLTATTHTALNKTWQAVCQDGETVFNLSGPSIAICEGAGGSDGTNSTSELIF